MENTEAKAIAVLGNPVKLLDRGALVAVNQDYNVQDLEKYQAGRNRARGVLNTPSFEDFKSFVLKETQQGEAPVFVDHKNVSATAILNFDIDQHDQGHCDYQTVLKLEPTVVWSKLQNLKDRKLSQRDFAVFVEDWVSVLEITEENGQIIGGGVALHAIRNMHIQSTVSNEAAVTNQSESRSRMESVEAKSKEGVTPAYFKITDPAFLGLEPRLIVLRLIVNTNDEKPVFALQIVKEELLLDEIIKDFKEKVIALLPENSVRIGTFTA